MCVSVCVCACVVRYYSAMYVCLCTAISARPKDPRWSKYREFSRHLEAELKDSLLRDLKACVEDEPNTFYQLLPSLYTEVNNRVLLCLYLGLLRCEAVCMQL